MNFTKEVDYIFNFEANGDMVTHKESHYINDVDGRRYRWQDPTNEHNPMPFNFQGTGNSYQEIEAQLIGSKQMYSSPARVVWHVEYALPDIDYVVITTVTKSVQFTPDGDLVFYNFDIGSVDAYKQKIGESA